MTKRFKNYLMVLAAALIMWAIIISLIVWALS